MDDLKFDDTELDLLGDEMFELDSEEYNEDSTEDMEEYTDGIETEDSGIGVDMDIDFGDNTSSIELEDEDIELGDESVEYVEERESEEKLTDVNNDDSKDIDAVSSDSVTSSDEGSNTEGVMSAAQDESNFINEIGEITIQDAEDDMTGFTLEYISIENIAIARRIRNLDSAEALVRSIKSTGLIEPIVVAPTVTEGLYVLIHGLRRLNACAKAGKTKVPCVVNNHISTSEIPVIEAMYNHSKPYTMREQIDFIDFLEKEKGIMNATMIEYLLQMNSGDYSKLKDILSDDDEEIVSRLLSGEYNIATAFKKLEQRRKKESAEEKENRKAEKVYENEEESGVDQLEGSGDEVDGEGLTDEQIKSLAINPENLDDDIEDSSLEEMIEEDKHIEGFEPHKQKVGEREYIDPAIRKAVLVRDKSTCQCCKRGGEQYVDILDYHHLLPVFLGGADTPDNGIMLCVACHRLVHLYSTGDLHIDNALLEGSYEGLSDDKKEHYENEQIFEDEKNRFKRIIKLGSIIRKGIAAKGMNRQQYKKEHSNNGIGRRKPGVNAPQELA